MATQAANVNVAVSGGVYTAPLGTALPADAAVALNAAFLDLGYLGEDGVTQQINGTTKDIKAWQNGDIVRTIQTEHKLEFKFTMIETNAPVLTLFSGANYATGIVQIKAGVMPHVAFIVEVLDGADHIRIAIPDGQISDRGDIVYKNGEPIGYPVTVTCFPDAPGVKAYIHYAASSLGG